MTASVHHKASQQRRLIVVAVLAISMPTVVSYVRALQRPSHSSWPMRTGLWLREHHMSFAVDSIEWCWYTIRRNHTVHGVRPDHPTLLHDALSGAEDLLAAHSPAHDVSCRFRHCTSTEGAWRGLGTSVAGAPALYAAYFRPDPEHEQVWVGAIFIDPTRVRASLVAGTREPRDFEGRWGGAIPLAERARLVGAFNAGFRFDEAAGGFYAEGRVGVRLRDGVAAFVVYRDGHADVDVWGSRLRMSPDVVAVRQNLKLIVSAEHVVGGLDRNANGDWGAGRNQGLYTWRSGLGITADAALIYVAGDGLTLSTLAQALVQAGCARAMELDIHDEWTTFEIYVRSPTAADVVIGKKLLSGMAFDDRRYLVPDDRDFIALFAR